MKTTTRTALLLVFALCFGAICGQGSIDWATLTAEQLSQLSPDSFKTITAAQLGSIPAAACQGFSFSQVTALPVAAALGLTSACLAQFPSGSPGACAGFLAEFIGAMSPQAFAGWRSPCIADLPNTAFSQVTAAQMADLDVSVCGTFTSGLTANFNPASASGIKAACIFQLSHTEDGLGGCSGLQPNFIAAISPQAFSGWTAGCTSMLSPDSFSRVTSEQWTYITASACSGFKSNTVAKFNATSGSGMPAACLAQFTHTSDGLGGCSGFMAPFVSSLSPAAFAGWTAGCTNMLNQQAFFQVTAEQWAAINATACSGFKSTTVANFNPAGAAGVQTDCLFQFSATTDGLGGCSGLKAAFVAGLTPKGFSGFALECISMAPSDTFSQATSEQLAALDPAACGGFKSTQVNQFPVSAAPGIKSDCFAAFSATTEGLGGCSGLAPAFVGAMTPAAFSGFRGACASVVPTNIFTAINSTQLNNIPERTFANFSTVAVSNIQVQAWTGATSQQVLELTSDGFAGVCVDCLGVVVNNLKTELVNRLTVAQTALYPLNYASLFKSNIPARVEYLTEWDTVSTDLATASWLKIALLKKGDQGPVFNEQTLKALPTSAYEGLRADHVDLIAAADFKFLVGAQTSYLTNDTVSAITADQLREISPGAFGAISGFGFSGIKPDVIPAITGQQIVNLNVNQINALDCLQLQKFTVEQLRLLTETQKQIYDTDYKARCNADAPPFAALPPFNSPPLAETPFSETPSLVNAPANGNSPSSNTEGPAGSKEPTAAKVFLIVAGCILAVLIVGAIIMWTIRRKRSDPTRQPLIA